MTKKNKTISKHTGSRLVGPRRSIRWVLFSFFFWGGEVNACTFPVTLIFVHGKIEEENTGCAVEPFFSPFPTVHSTRSFARQKCFYRSVAP